MALCHAGSTQRKLIWGAINLKVQEDFWVVISLLLERLKASLCLDVNCIYQKIHFLINCYVFFSKFHRNIRTVLPVCPLSVLNFWLHFIFFLLLLLLIGWGWAEWRLGMAAGGSDWEVWDGIVKSITLTVMDSCHDFFYSFNPYINEGWVEHEILFSFRRLESHHYSTFCWRHSNLMTSYLASIILCTLVLVYVLWVYSVLTSFSPLGHSLYLPLSFQVVYFSSAYKYAFMGKLDTLVGRREGKGKHPSP